MKKIKTIFIGTSFEAVPSLEQLIKSPNFEITAVATQPDRPTGRKQIMTATPVKEVAQKNNIKIYTPENKQEIYQKIIDEQRPELMITIAFGEILPGFFLKFPKYKCLNIHYSLLPQLRGAVPVQMAILQGMKETGVTIQVMEKTLDTGPIIVQEKVAIETRETTISLKDKLVPMGTELLMKTLPEWIKGNIDLRMQDNSKATYCYTKDIAKENAQIKWENQTPAEIDRMIRAFLPWPVAWMFTENNKRLKIFQAQITKLIHKKRPGELFRFEKDSFVATNDPNFALRLDDIQQEGKNRISGNLFAQSLAK
ncbi:methionyl-tRNA formyltransferase [Candidatus Dojkabacteria bacterium]|nr:methionyl-tRNA formyltransferase [Candidatus Dojkabacteria bacterium]